MTRRYNAQYVLFVGPAMAAFASFFVVPFFAGIRFSLTSWNGISGTADFVGIANYVRLFTRDRLFWASFRNTLLYTAGHVALVNVAAFFLAVILTQPIAFRRQLRVLFFTPNFLSLVVVGQIWRFLMGQASQDLFELTGLSFFATGWISNPDIAIWSVVLASAWQAVGWFALIYIAGLESVPREVIEAARVDGAGRTRLYRSVIVPMIVPSITISLFLTLINSLRVFDIVYAMTQGGPGNATQTAILNIYDTTFGSSMYGYGTAKSMVMVVVIGVIAFAQVALLKSREVEY